MSQYGFVYILGNEFMPNVVKIGCTERSPRARAEELSRATGVPGPFQVLCYAEFENFQAVESRMHEWCKKHRVNPVREFFHDCLPWAVSLLWFHPDRLAFTDATAGTSYAGDSELCMLACKEKHQNTIDDLRNPFGNKEQEDEREARLIRYANGEFGEETEVVSNVVPELDGPSAGAEEPPLRVVGGTEA